MACAANQLAQESSQEDVQREAHELAEDLISYRIGKRSTPPTPTSATLRRLSDQLEGRHAVLLNDMCTQLNVTTVGTRSKFTEVADEVFRGGINWGRIVALFTFGGRLAQACRRNGVAHDAEQVSTWVGDYVAGLSDWIGSQGGWEAFHQHFEGDAPPAADRLWRNTMFLAAVGAGVIAIAFCHVPLP